MENNALHDRSSQVQANQLLAPPEPGIVIPFRSVLWRHPGLTPEPAFRCCLYYISVRCKLPHVHLEHRPSCSPLAERIGPFLAGTYVLGVDLPLCAVADTLTLPITIRAAQRGETINTLLIIDRPPTPAATADGLPARANTPPR